MGAWFLQTVLAGVVMVPVTAVFALSLDLYYDGSLAVIGGLIAVVVFCVALISVVSLLGIPLRVVEPARRWWRARPWVALILVAVGALAIYFARLLATLERWEVEDGFFTESYNAHPVLAVAGFLILAFGLVHWWPRRERAPYPDIV